MHTTPLLPLESFRRIIGWNPFHFWGLANSTVPVTSACNALVKQYAWQAADAAGRTEIQEAILTAEKRLRDHLGFSVAPHYVTETLTWPRFHDRRAWNLSHTDGDGRWLSVRLSEGHVRAVGVETRTLIDGAVAVTYSDEDGDDLDETATISVATTVTDSDQIAVYFGASDRLDSEAVGEKWRIAPLSVSISGGTATIKGRAWQFVKPLKYEGVGTAALDPATAANFVTTVAVYRRYTNPDGNTTATSQALLIWETPPWPDWALCTGCSSGTDNSTDPAAEAYGIARAGIRDAAAGIVAPGRAAYNATTGVWSATNWGICRPPDRVTVRVLAGVALEDGQMARRWQTVVARLAAAELARPICGCEMANRELYRWQFDLARAAGANDEQFAISAQDLDNPLGTRRGQVLAWKEVKALRNTIGFVPG